ncbi:MAG: hypothetical protein Q9195_009221 [Heterodermia aff. obscurata]
MLHPLATLTIIGVYLVLVSWICIGGFTWAWYSPFKKAQRCSRAGLYVILHESIPDALTATIILAVVQELGFIFVLGNLITIFVDTSRTEDPDQNTLLFHLLCFWSFFTVVCSITGGILALSSYTFLGRLERVSWYDWESRAAMHVDDLAVEDGSAYFSDPPDTGSVVDDNDSLSGYGTFVHSTTVDDDYADSPYGTPWAFRRDWWKQQAPPPPAPRPASPQPITGMQTEHDEIDSCGEELLGLPFAPFDDPIPEIFERRSEGRG